MVEEQHSHCFQGQCNNILKAVALQVLIRNVWIITGNRSLLIQALAVHTICLPMHSSSITFANVDFWNQLQTCETNVLPLIVLSLISQVYTMLVCNHVCRSYVCKWI